MTSEEMAQAVEGMSWLVSRNGTDDSPQCTEIAAELRRTCEWTEDSDGNRTTKCGHPVEFIDEASLADYDFKFCGYCGGTLIERPYVEPMRLTQEPT